MYSAFPNEPSSLNLTYISGSQPVVRTAFVCHFVIIDFQGISGSWSKAVEFAAPLFVLPIVCCLSWVCLRLCPFKSLILHSMIFWFPDQLCFNSVAQGNYD